MIVRRGTVDRVSVAWDSVLTYQISKAAPRLTFDPFELPRVVSNILVRRVSASCEGETTTD